MAFERYLKSLGAGSDEALLAFAASPQLVSRPGGHAEGPRPLAAPLPVIAVDELNGSS